MATGVRVLHQLKAMAPDARHHIVFPGSQFGGSPGAGLVGGEPEVKMHGKRVPVRAHVSHLEGCCGHVDRIELMQWLSHIKTAPRQTRVAPGEAAEA